MRYPMRASRAGTVTPGITPRRLGLVSVATPWDNPPMRNIALGALWVIAGLCVLIGFIMITTSQGGGGLFDTPDYGGIYPGAGLVSLGVLCALGALVAAAVGFYVERAQYAVLAVLNPAQPTPADDAAADRGRGARFAKATKAGMSWPDEV